MLSRVRQRLTGPVWAHVELIGDFVVPSSDMSAPAAPH